MDSGNTSGSLQSSSGDEQEYDSRAHQSNTAFITPSLQQSSLSSMFDPLSNFLLENNHNQNPNSLPIDTIWSKSIRSDPNSTDLIVSSPGGFMATSSSSSPSRSQFFSNINNRPNYGSYPNNAAAGLGSGSGSITDHQTNISSSVQTLSTKNNSNSNNIGVVRNPKKRSRASRRAPTTVLTTDTTNFRAMVQEFTGIPAPPFSATSAFPRTRFDLFGLRPPNLDNNNPPYLLRPFAQKFQPPITSNPSNLDATTSNNSGGGNYQLPQNLLSMQNPLLNFQSGNINRVLGSKQPLEDQFGLRGDGSNQTGNWSGDHHGNDQCGDLLRSINGGGYNNGNSSEPTSNQKINSISFSSLGSSSLDFHGEKGPDQNVAGGAAVNSTGTRNEGMMEPWICSSD
ncbi:uncharacterized protein [Rutidosis leptorrhynchoides]|uniref:uncharacterized protein n=1 Tax=Rutidosis leptorrhynchoides TaxID=125765 RepID=UPI003A994715